jgi:hypothetical protein
MMVIKINSHMCFLNNNHWLEVDACCKVSSIQAPDHHHNNNYGNHGLYCKVKTGDINTSENSISDSTNYLNNSK